MSGFATGGAELLHNWHLLIGSCWALFTTQMWDDLLLSISPALVQNKCNNGMTLNIFMDKRGRFFPHWVSWDISAVLTHASHQMEVLLRDGSWGELCAFNSILPVFNACNPQSRAWKQSIVDKKSIGPTPGWHCTLKHFLSLWEITLKSCM